MPRKPTAKQVAKKLADHFLQTGQFVNAPNYGKDIRHVRTYPKSLKHNDVTAGPLTDEAIDEGDDDQSGKEDGVSTIGM